MMVWNIPPNSIPSPPFVCASCYNNTGAEFNSMVVDRGIHRIRKTRRYHCLPKWRTSRKRRLLHEVHYLHRHQSLDPNRPYSGFIRPSLFSLSAFQCRYLAVSLHLYTRSDAPLPLPLDVTDHRSQMDHCTDDTPILLPISSKQVGPLLDDRRVLNRLCSRRWLGKDVVISHR